MPTRTNRAAKAHRTAIALEPGEPMPYFSRRAALGSAGRPAEAVPRFLQAAALSSEGWVQWAAEATASTLNAGPAVKTLSRAVVRPVGSRPYRARGAGDGAARLWFPAGVGCLVRARLWIKEAARWVQHRVSGAAKLRMPSGPKLRP